MVRDDLEGRSFAVSFEKIAWRDRSNICDTSFIDRQLRGESGKAI